MESQPEKTEFRNNPENFHSCFKDMITIPGIKFSISLATLLYASNVHTSCYQFSIFIGLDKQNC